MNVHTALLTGITAAGTYCALRKKAAASSSYMAWRNAGIIHLLGTVYESVPVFGILPDDSSCVGSVSCLNQ